MSYLLEVDVIRFCFMFLSVCFPEYMYVQHMGAIFQLERALDTLALELQALVSYHVGPGNHA